MQVGVQAMTGALAGQPLKVCGRRGRWRDRLFSHRSCVSCIDMVVHTTWRRVLGRRRFQDQMRPRHHDHHNALRQGGATSVSFGVFARRWPHRRRQVRC